MLFKRFACYHLPGDSQREVSGAALTYLYFTKLRLSELSHTPGIIHQTGGGASEDPDFLAAESGVCSSRQLHQTVYCYFSPICPTCANREGFSEPSIKL